MLSHVRGDDVSTASRMSVAEASEAMIISRAGWNCALISIVSFVFGLADQLQTYMQALSNSVSRLNQRFISLWPGTINAFSPLR